MKKMLKEKYVALLEKAKEDFNKYNSELDLKNLECKLAQEIDNSNFKNLNDKLKKEQEELKNTVNVHKKEVDFYSQMLEKIT